MAEHEATFCDFIRDDNRGKKLPAYVKRVTEAMCEERLTVNNEFDDLVRNVEHIKEIVAVQQSMAGSSGLMQELEVRDLINDALTASKASLLNHQIEIAINVDQEANKIMSDKHRILQILINLIKNAKDALVEDQTQQPRISIDAQRVNDSLRLSVTDNGPGIARDKMTEIFQHGFTTKKTGHGFGLHSSANAASELGGTLSVFSDGIGHGARFDLQLPMNQRFISEPVS